MKIDILTSFDVVEFPVAYERREWGVENETVIPIISKQDLVLIKQEAARDPKRKTKEYIDINCLEGNNVV